MKTEIATAGTVILTEFQKPTRTPRHCVPIQAPDQAVFHASKSMVSGKAKIRPWRISSIVFSEVTSIV